MATPKKQSKFEKLKAKWYKKLEKSGFTDIEQEDGNLKLWSLKFTKDHPTVSSAKAVYYQAATNFVDDYKFDTKLDQVVWEYHANGLSYREITKLLKEVNIKTNRTYVMQTIQKLKKSMFTMYLCQHKEYHDT